MNRALAGILCLGLFIAGVSLVLWLTRHFRAKGSILDAKVACALTAVSFVFVGWGIILSALPPAGQAVGASGKALPPDIFAFAPAAMFHITALLTAIGLLLGAAFQLVSSWLSPPGDARRKNAAHLAAYGVAAFVVAIAHHTLMRVGPGLLK